MCKITATLEASTCYLFAVVSILSAGLASVQFAEGNRAGQSGGVELCQMYLIFFTFEASPHDYLGLFAPSNQNIVH